MQSRELLISSLNANMKVTLQLIEDMRDAPLTFPTVNGGNHPLWVLGHLAYSVGECVQEIMLGEANPLVSWKEIFGYGSEPTDDANAYPSFDVVLQEFRDAHVGLLTRLESMGETDLDSLSKGCPAEYREQYGTYRLCISAVTDHLLIHRGQVADARRSAGRPPL